MSPTVSKNFGESLYRKLFEVAGDSIIVCSEHGVAIECNQAALDLFACTREKLIGTSPIDWSPEFQPNGRRSDEMAAEIFSRVIAGGMARFEWENQRADGASCPVDVTVRHARIDHRDLFVVISRGIAERKQADHVLKSSEAKYRALVETTGTGYLIIDTEGRVLDANPEYVRLTGHASIQDILGRSVIEWTANNQREKNALAVAQCARDGFIRDFVIDYVDGKGRITPIEISATVVAEGDTSRIIALCRDITERKQAEEELLTAKTAAETANLTKSRFLAAASHDLRQPMQAISLFNDALARAGLSEEQKRISDYLLQSIQSMGDLLNALLDISKLDAGAIEVCHDMIEVEALAHKIKAEYLTMAAVKSLRFKLCFPFRNMAILTDSKLLMNLLGNLIGNAIKYTQQGGVLVCIRRRGTQALIQVWDTGIGIPVEHLNAIYEEYFQIDNPERDRTKGLGLGLAIAQRMAKILGTEIVCRSRLGKGSVFEFCLPLAFSAETIAPNRSDPPVVSHDAKPAGRRIALVEDDLMVATAIKLALESCGMSVTRYKTAEEALADAAIDEADFYISDFRLPGLSGVEFLDAMQQRTPKPIQALVMTGDTAIDRIELVRSTSWRVLFKPVELSTLLSAIKSEDLVH